MEAPDFFVEDLLDLPNGDEMMADAFFDSSAAANSTDSSTVTAVDSCNSSISGGTDNHFLPDLPNRSLADAHFSGDLCVPYDDLAELEWLSNFVEESFSSEDLHKLHLLNGSAVAQPRYQARPGPISSLHHHHHNSASILGPDGPVPGKVRSKLARVAPSDWSTRLLMVSPTSSSTGHLPVGPATAPPKKPARKRAENPDSPNSGEVRRCLHCAAEKTPQWRTGPMGPKTLCNACGVRYKSGRLVPEYRPAASPTFVSAKHSNSHRKVLELRRQKDVQRHHPVQHHPQFPVHPSAAAGVYVGGEDYMIHHHMGSDYRQLI